MVLIRCVNVKLPLSSNGYVLDSCFFVTVVIVLFPGSRREQICRKDERVIYKFDIQEFLSCLFEVASKL
jgi:hypothetical protein